MTDEAGVSVYRKFDDGYLSDDVLRCAEQELGETSEVREKCLSELKTSLKEISNLRSRTDDEFLLRFLRVSKFDTTSALRRLQKYYAVQKQYHELFYNLHPKSVAELLNANQTHFFLPLRHSDNSTICLHKRGMFDSSVMKLEDMLRLDILSSELISDNPVTQICGLTSIVDCKGMGVKSLITMGSPISMRRVLNVTIGRFPFRQKRIHIINGSPILNFLYSIASPFLSKKIKDRFVFHRGGDNWSSLHAHLPPEVLPEEYGGRLGPLDPSRLPQLLMEKDDLFQERLKYGYMD